MMSPSRRKVNGLAAGEIAPDLEAGMPLDLRARCDAPHECESNRGNLRGIISQTPDHARVTVVDGFIDHRTVTRIGWV